MLEDLGSRVARRQIQTVPPLPAGSFYSLCEHIVTILLTLRTLFDYSTHFVFFCYVYSALMILTLLFSFTLFALHCILR